MSLDQYPDFHPTPNGLWHGGDYNPEQWPREVWEEDARLMDVAGWNVATVGVFSWVSLEPSEANYTFDWLEAVLDRLHASGRKAMLATPSAAAPAWLSQKYPETLRVGADGHRMKHGNRVNYCLTSPVYREKTRTMAIELAKRFGNHPALALWHISNEYGEACHCALCEEAFRGWLKKKFAGDLDRLNAAYWTAFWGHTYTDWSQIEIPGRPYGETAVHGLTIDWRRFVSDQTIDLYLNEADAVREISPNIPLTTNFMGFYGGINYWKMAEHVDITSWDSYPAFRGRLSEPQTWQFVAFAHDLTRSLKRRPFLLMECTPSASNWYPELELKRPGMHQMEGMQAIAHGSDSVQYFQWRQSRGGQEKFHGGVVGHDGTERSRVFQDVARMGQQLREIGEVAGSTTQAQVAVVYDWENAWGIESACGPRQGPRGYHESCFAHYRAFLEDGIPVDLVPADGDWSPYRLIIAPMLYMIKPGVAESISAFVANGGTFVTSYWTGIVDENDLCFTGGFPGGAGSPLRANLGIWGEELDVLYPGHTRRVQMEADAEEGWPGTFEANTFCDLIHLESAKAIGYYADGFYAGRPAVTVNAHGQGEAYYVASRNEPAFQTALARTLAARLGLKKSMESDVPEGVVVRHRTGAQDYVFLLNLTGEEKSVTVDADMSPLFGATSEKGLTHTLAPYGTAVFTRPLPV